MTGCRIVRLSYTGAGQSDPFRLHAACGWGCDVAQGVAWEEHPARAEWLTHRCVRPAGVEAS